MLLLLAAACAMACPAQALSAIARLKANDEIKPLGTARGILNQFTPMIGLSVVL